MFIRDTDAFILRNRARGFAGLTGLIESYFRSEKPAEFDFTILAALARGDISIGRMILRGDST